MIQLSLGQVGLGLLPILIAALIFGLVLQDWTSVAWASLRMFGQLIFIGYALAIIFDLQHPLWVMVVVSLMSIGAGWIALRAMRKYNRPIWPVFAAVLLAGGLNLIWILGVVIRPEPWFSPAVVIPLTGMVMATAMNAVSLCAERFWAERKQGIAANEAGHAALSACMIPHINALLAVGLVSLPGMMTGQILSGVSPLVAVRYQIIIMA
ncbi:MAG: putative ABC transport system permease protein, partial [Reinekea sp.]